MTDQRKLKQLQQANYSIINEKLCDDVNIAYAIPVTGFSAYLPNYLYRRLQKPA